MPRKQRCRWIGGYPDHWEFSPEEVSDKEPVVLSLDEFETIRLLDREGLTQEQSAERMGIARTTVTAIYESARRKVAEALVDGKRLLIRGGNYRLNDQGAENIIQKGTGNMRIAVTYENGEVFQHFGHTEQFKLYDIEDGKIVSEQIVPTNGSGHGALAGFLKAAQVDALICGSAGRLPESGAGRRADLRRHRHRRAERAGRGKYQALRRRFRLRRHGRTGSGGRLAAV